MFDRLNNFIQIDSLGIIPSIFASLPVSAASDYTVSGFRK